MTISESVPPHVLTFDELQKRITAESQEFNCISMIPGLLEFASDRKYQSDVDTLCDTLITRINPYAFEMVFTEISKIFTSVKYQSKIAGLKMIMTYARVYPQVVSSNLPIIIDALIQLSSDIKK